MNFDKVAKSDKKNWGRGGGGTETKTVLGGGGGALKPKQYAKCNYLHNVEYVVQSTFQNTLISF